MTAHPRKPEHAQGDPVTMTTTTTPTATDPTVDALLAAIPELAALDRLCQQAREDGAALDPVWVVGPVVAHFVGRTRAVPYAPPVMPRYEDLPGTPEQRHEAQRVGRWDASLAAVTRHLAGMEPDEPLVANHRFKPDDRCSPLLRDDFPGQPVALSRPSHDGYADRIQAAADDFQPLRDVKYLDGRVACLFAIAFGVRIDHREAAAQDFRTVAATLAGPTRWNVALGWDSGLGNDLNWRYRYSPSAAAQWAQSILRHRAALTRICEAFIPSTSAVD
jgi:hypothetical protein